MAGKVAVSRRRMNSWRIASAVFCDVARFFRLKTLLPVLLAGVFGGCVHPGSESTDSAANYAAVFKTMRQPSPIILNSRLDHYSKSFGPWQGGERNGEWEFEILATKAWLDEVKHGFVPTTFNDGFRSPRVAWWKPDAEHFDVYHMPYSSYSAAHLYVEKNPKDPDRIHVFIQRH